jgi:hypothetical protein
VNLLRKKKVEGQKHGQKGLFVTGNTPQSWVEVPMPIHEIRVRSSHRVNGPLIDGEFMFVHLSGE